MGYAEKCKILEMHDLQSNWAPPVESEKEEIENARRVFARMCIPGGRSYMHIFRTEPYIDMLYIQFDHSGYPEHTKRFSIHEGFAWDYEDEQFFHAHCVRSDTCICLNKPIDIIYNLYSAAHPEWHLQRYYTHNLRVIDHVYHCMRQNTVKEMLYKAELSELAVYVDDLDEINLVANKPSDLYDGLPMRVLRALNNKEGAALLSNAADRKYIRELNARYPDLFSCSLNEAQCCYLAMLIKGRLLPGETGRLFREKKADYSYDWCRSIFALKIAGEKNSMGLRRFKQMFHDEIAVHDPVYRGYMSKIKTEEDLLVSGNETG